MFSKLETMLVLHNRIGFGRSCYKHIRHGIERKSKSDQIEKAIQLEKVSVGLRISVLEYVMYISNTVL